MNPGTAEKRKANTKTEQKKQKEQNAKKKSSKQGDLRLNLTAAGRQNNGPEEKQPKKNLKHRTADPRKTNQKTSKNHRKKQKKPKSKKK